MPCFLGQCLLFFEQKKQYGPVYPKSQDILATTLICLKIFQCSRALQLVSLLQLVKWKPGVYSPGSSQRMYIQEWQFLDDIQTFLWIRVILANSYRCAYWPVSLHLLCVLLSPVSTASIWISSHRGAKSLRRGKACDSSWRRPDVMFPLPVTMNTLPFQNNLDFKGCTDSFIAFHYYLEELLPKRSFLLQWMHREPSGAFRLILLHSCLLSLLFANYSPKGFLHNFVKLNQTAKVKPIAKHQCSSRTCCSAPSSMQRHREVSQTFLQRLWLYVQRRLRRRSWADWDDY